MRASDKSCSADDMHFSGAGPARASSSVAFVDVDLTTASGPAAVSLASDLESTCSSRFNVANLAVRDSVELVSNVAPFKMNRYFKVLAQYPIVILISIACLSVACIIVSLSTEKLPSFNDPTVGFETRGTILSQRLTAWYNLLEATRPSGPLTLNVADLSPSSTPSSIEATSSISTKKQNDRNPENTRIYVTQSPADKSPTVYPANEQSELDQNRNWTFGINVSEPQPDKNVSKVWKILRKEVNEHRQAHDHNHLSTDGFFCGAPDPVYSHMVLSSRNGSNLLSLEALHEACALDLAARRNPYFSENCVTTNVEGDNNCCNSWALHNYVVVLSNLTSCSQIKEEDVENTRKMLIKCANYYHVSKLPSDCQRNTVEPSAICFSMPSECIKHNAVYNIMRYLVDADFLPPDNLTHSIVTHSMLFLPMARSPATLNYYKALNIEDLTVQNVEVSAMDLGLKSALFDDCLVRDTWLIGMGAVGVFFCMWVYTGSFFVTIMTIIAVALSLGISYFFYTVVFGLKFFPFMNLLACVVAVGVGADDAFIFCKVWESTKDEKRETFLIQLIQESFDHAFLSMFVTSFTTAVAFFASCISSITAIRCFSIFAGTSMIANLFLMVTWLPAVIILSEKVNCRTRTCLPLNAYFRVLRSYVDRFSSEFDKVLIFLVNGIPYIWILILGLIACGSAVLVLCCPGLHLPDSPELQLFDSSHPFELYDSEYRNKFRFERLEQQEPAENMPLRFVWGVKPVDFGNYMNPHSIGKLELDSSFDIGSNVSQVWLKNFCVELKKQSFYQRTSDSYQNCFIETLESWMLRPCEDLSKQSLKPCCKTSHFPYRRNVLMQCSAQAMQSIFRAPFRHGIGGPRFTKNITHPKIRAIVVEYDSNFTYSMSHQDMHSFYSQVENWMQDQNRIAPPGMRKGWFVSDFRFYDLQHTVFQSTIHAIMVSMSMSLLVLLIVTLNVFVSLFAVLSITCTIFVTIAALVLLGWQLNVLESVAICTAIGLAVDFSLHYSVSYRLAPDNTGREEAVKFSLKRMAGPTAMGALTTAVAGIFMLPSTVLAYIQIGKFLIILMTVSWTYSTFFLLSLLRVAGPRHGFGQFSYSNMFCRTLKNRRLQQSSDVSGGPDKLVFENVLSETTLSTSSIRHALHPSTSETHELEALSNPGRRISRRGQRSGSLSVVRPSQSNMSDQSPSAASANTIILCDDVDLSRHHT